MGGGDWKGANLTSSSDEAGANFFFFLPLFDVHLCPYSIASSTYWRRLFLEGGSWGTPSPCSSRFFMATRLRVE